MQNLNNLQGGFRQSSVTIAPLNTVENTKFTKIRKKTRQAGTPKLASTGELPKTKLASSTDCLR